MKIPSLVMANEFLEEGKRLNPGSWINHSLNTATAAKLIAEHDNYLDPEVSYILGLLHDIGRREGVSFTRHTIDGYNFLMRKGFPDSARICMTHTHSAKGEWDCTIEEYDFVKDFFNDIQFDEYDLLIQLCDAIALPSGFCFIEKRMVEAVIRNEERILKIIEYALDVWKTVFRIKRHFDERIGCSIYTLLPGVIENTFEVNTEDIYKYLNISNNKGLSLKD